MWLPILTVRDCDSSAGLRQTIALAYMTTHAHVHEALCGKREWSSSAEQQSCFSTQECAHPFKQEA